MSLLRYGVVIQGTLGEFARYPETRLALVKRLLEHPSIYNVVVAAPSIDFDPESQKLLESLGIRTYIGDDYNVAARVMKAQEISGWSDQIMVARICASWGLIDLALVDSMMEEALKKPCSYLCIPKDFDYTVAADIASQEALYKISNISDDMQFSHRAKFNPWGYMEAFADQFSNRLFHDVPTYSHDFMQEQLRVHKNIFDENEFYGRDYAGSRYDSLVDEITENDVVLDLATGSGHGAARISEKAALVIGVDYLPQYVERARSNYPEHSRLRFVQGDAANFLYESGNFFSVALSLHTIEHVPDERALLRSIYKNLRSRGKLILEVPLMMKRPWGRPTNPYHIREYSVDRIRALVTEEGFNIYRHSGGCRGFYFDGFEEMRGDYRLYLRKS